MKKNDLALFVDMISDKVAEKVIDFLKGKKIVADEPELVDSAEAAKILGYSRTYLSTIKDRFSYVKMGDTPQSRILFRKDELIKHLINSQNG